MTLSVEKTTSPTSMTGSCFWASASSGGARQVVVAVTAARAVGAENAVTSRDLHVLVHETAEAVPSEGMDGRAGGWGSAAGGRVLIK